MSATGSSSPLRSVTADEIATFWRDGVVCLRSIMPGDWLERMAGPVDETILDSAVTTDMSAMGADLAAGLGATVLVDERPTRVPRGQFRSGVDHWRTHPDFRAFAVESPLPEIVATLLRSAQVNLYEDSVLVKEPGTVERTAFHQDQAYFHVEGTQVCTTWVPLDPVTRETGAVGFVRGSHEWDRKWRPNFFVTTESLPDTDGDVVPDIHAVLDDYDVVFFDTDPGDITVHHARTLHGAEANRSPTRRRRAISVRYCGDDARYRIRRGAPLKPHHHEVTDGAPVDHEACPVVWPR